ncbi:hypothetical protein Pint_19083 [Pistacia integerrima]|uniref:Uncharacterized protein n=1 Tax=Pistacia integerrima TaxID=434235 RepID=A0ACC0Z0Q1_9ROSI|nr:hypothetical protein Pint_19083 [Pistacia integerrima]
MSSFTSNSASGSGSGAGPASWGIGLSNTIHSEVAPCLPLPSLQVFCGATDPDLCLFDEVSTGSYGSYRSLNRPEILAQSSRIADLLRETDVSYLHLRDQLNPVSCSYVEPLELHNQVLQCDAEAFEYVTPGQIKEQVSGRAVFERKDSRTSVPVTSSGPVVFERKDYQTSVPVTSSGPAVFERKDFQASVPLTSGFQRDYNESQNHQLNRVLVNKLILQEISTSSSRKPKVKKRAGNDFSSSAQPDPTELQDAAVESFCEMLEDFCGRATTPTDDQNEPEWLSLPVADIRMLVLDHQIHRAEGLSIDEREHMIVYLLPFPWHMPVRESDNGVVCSSIQLFA